MKNSLLPYCERINTAAESINVASNSAFVLVSVYMVFLIWRRTNQATGPSRKHGLLPLALLPLLIGVGSSAYHYHPSTLTLLLDLGPIGLFAGATLYLCLRHILAYSRSRSWTYLCLWLIATGFSAPWPGFAYGSLIYVPTLIAILLVAAASRNRLISTAGVLFALALTLRTLDLPLCEQLTTGTHPLWHGIAAVVSLMLLLALHRTTRNSSKLPQYAGDNVF